MTMTEQYRITKTGHEALAEQGITIEEFEEARKAMNENDFERELVKAIEHGCPECGHYNLVATCTEEHSYDLLTDTDDGTNYVVDYDEDDDLAGPRTITRVWCWDCDTVLWTAETGWIPELQEIVKGE